MQGSGHKQRLVNLLEAVPYIIFLALWRSGLDIELAGWIGAGLAAVLLFILRFYRIEYDPITLGINLHLLIITPLITGVYSAGAAALGALLTAHAYQGALISIFITGCLLTLLSPRGFIGMAGLERADRLKYSVLLLVASAATIVWSFTSGEGPLVAIVLPVIALFGLRRLLLARCAGLLSKNTAVIGAAPAGDAA
jgi:hypothetical protein